MARQIIREDWRVEVRPRRPGDLGWASVHLDWQPGEEERACRELVDQIVRHVEGTGRNYVTVTCDEKEVCSFCGYTFDPSGECCDAALAEYEAATRKAEQTVNSLPKFAGLDEAMDRLAGTKREKGD